MAAKKKKSSANKSLLELVEEKAGDSALSGKNRAIVLDMKDEIAAVLARGYKWRVIWETLTESGRIEMGYDTFRMHCRAIGLELAPKSYSRSKKVPRRRGPSRHLSQRAGIMSRCGNLPSKGDRHGDSPPPKAAPPRIPTTRPARVSPTHEAAAPAARESWPRPPPADRPRGPCPPALHPRQASRR